MIFTDIQRIDMNCSGYSEPTYSYLNRSARIPAIRVRELVEKWFSHFPPEGQIELLPRLQSSDDKVFIPAFFELFSKELLNHLGFEARIHPSFNNKSSKKPDFYVQGHNEEFILESVSTDEQSDEERRTQTLLHGVFDKINEIQSKDFFANIAVRGNATATIPSRAMRDEIQTWIDSLNYQEIKQIYQSEDYYDKLPKKKFFSNGVTLIVTPIPKNLNREKPGRLIGSSSITGFRIVNTKEAIRRAIKRKNSRYGLLGIPYILLINVLSISCDNEDVIEALFGSEQFSINLDDINAPPIPSRIKDGVWTKAKGTRLSGILIVKNLNPWTIAYQNPILYLNPWASHIYHGALLKLPYVKINVDGRICFYEGKDIRSLLELPEKWPEND
jgi:hypothetical protein